MSGWHQLALCALALIVAALAVVPLELQRRIVDDALGAEDARLLMRLAALYLAVLVVAGAVKLELRLYQGWLSESAIAYCRRHIVAIQDRSADDDESAGTTAAIVNAEIDTVGGMVGTALSDPTAKLGTLAAIVGYMVVVEPVVGAASVGLLLPQLVLVPVIQRKLNALIEKRIVHLRTLSEEVSGDDRQEVDSSRLIGQIYSNRVRYYLWKFSGKAALNFLNAAAPLLVLIVGGLMVVHGETEIGVVVAFISGFNKMAEPLRDLISDYRTYAQAAVKHDLIAEWMTDQLQRG